MRLDCPKCGAKGDSRAIKKPRWRCSPARSNGGCGYEWDDPEYNDPTINYKTVLQPSSPEEPEPSLFVRRFWARHLPNAESDRPKENFWDGYVERQKMACQCHVCSPRKPISSGIDLTQNRHSPTPSIRHPNGSLVENIGGFILALVGFGLFIAILVWMLMTFGGGGNAGGDGYKEECRMEDRGGRIREVCW